MRAVILALALMFGTANASDPFDREVQALLDRQQDRAAIALAQAAADRGEPRGHDWLGWFYESGQGAAVNLPLAAFHYRIAARGRNDHAAWRLGVLIDTGLIAGQPEEAVALFTEAADREYSNAMVSLAVMQATGRGTTQDFAAALGNYMRAARLANSQGVRGVGIMLYLGQGVAPDIEEAAAWLLLSAAMGSEEADLALERVLEELADDRLASVVRRSRELGAELGIDFEMLIEDELPAATLAI